MSELNAKKLVAPRGKLSLPGLYQEVCGLNDRLQLLHTAVTLESPKDVSLHIAGAFKFVQMAQQELLEKDAQDRKLLDRQLPWASLVLRCAKKEGMSGFGGNCFAAAIAINQVLFEGKLSYFVAANEAFREAGRTIGHATVYYKDVEGVRHHFDADGQLKLDTDVESWGMLDPEDPDYQEIADDLGVEWNDETASLVAMLEVSEAQIRSLTNEAEVQTLVGALRYAAPEIELTAGGQVEISLLSIETTDSCIAAAAASRRRRPSSNWAMPRTRN
jgi:hypothetical protein